MAVQTHLLDEHFPRYTTWDPQVPVWCLTPGEGRCFHRFFDTSPVSPSGRYLAITRLPAEDRLPTPGEPCEVVLVDLHTGAERVVASSHGWDTQLGAQAQWGSSDSELFFNDLDPATWRPFGVKHDPLTGARQELEGTVYMVSRDGRWAASSCLLRTGATQAGYGVIVPDDAWPRNHGAPDDDGIWLTDTTTGRCRLLISIRQLVETAQPRLHLPDYANGDFYGFHVKWNRQGDRLQYVIRWLDRDEPGRRLVHLVCCAADGSNPTVALGAAEWGKGGHHPDWAPDGETVTMNINFPPDGLRFVGFRYDGADYRRLHPTLRGSGHPLLHPNGRQIVTDAYVGEPVAYGDGSVPLRWCDLATGEVTDLVRIGSLPAFVGPKRELRVDPHPAWDRDDRFIAFNGCPDGTRRVYLADLSDVILPPDGG